MGNSKLTALEQALADGCPRLGRVGPLRAIGAGFSSSAYVTPDGVVVRVARNDFATRTQAMEAALLPKVAPLVPLPVPDVRCLIEPRDAAPFGAIAHGLIEGSALSPELVRTADTTAIIDDLASFLVALHRIPMRDVGGLGLPVHGTTEVDSLRIPSTSILEPFLTTAQARVFDSWWDDLLADASWKAVEPSLTHNDLWFAHVLLDATLRRVAGVIDFGDAVIGDRAADFATSMYVGRDFTWSLVEAYTRAGGELGEHFDDRLRRSWEIREIWGLPYDARYCPDELPIVVGKILEGPIFEPSARP